jgi:hypothetical protein
VVLATKKPRHLHIYPIVAHVLLVSRVEPFPLVFPCLQSAE